MLGASCLTGQYWFGSLWFYKHPEQAPDVDSCTAGVQLEAGVGGAQWVDATHVLVGLDTGEGQNIRHVFNKYQLTSVLTVKMKSLVKNLMSETCLH